MNIYMKTSNSSQLKIKSPTIKNANRRRWYCCPYGVRMCESARTLCEYRRWGGYQMSNITLTVEMTTAFKMCHTNSNSYHVSYEKSMSHFIFFNDCTANHLGVSVCKSLCLGQSQNTSLQFKSQQNLSLLDFLCFVNTVKCSWRKKNCPLYLLFCMKMSVLFLLHAKQPLDLMLRARKK